MPVFVAASVAPTAAGGRRVIVAAVVTIAVAAPERSTAPTTSTTPTTPTTSTTSTTSTTPTTPTTPTERSRAPVIAIAGPSSALSRPPTTIYVTTPGALVTAHATPATALRLYLGDQLIAQCPGPDCTTQGAALALRFRPTTIARYRVLAADGVITLTSTGDFDADVLAARARGARLALGVVEVIEVIDVVDAPAAP